MFKVSASATLTILAFPHYFGGLKVCWVEYLYFQNRKSSKIAAAWSSQYNAFL